MTATPNVARKAQYDRYKPQLDRGTVNPSCGNCTHIIKPSSKPAEFICAIHLTSMASSNLQFCEWHSLKPGHQRGR